MKPILVPEEASIRPLIESELPIIVDYFHSNNVSNLRGMGVDPLKLFPRDVWLDAISKDLQLSDEKKTTFYVGWLWKGALVGHSNMNKIKFGEEAYVHLHLWPNEKRRSGLGTVYFALSVNYFRQRFHLKRIFCEPFSENPGPNRLLPKLGFRFIESQKKVPGAINFEQVVNRYELDHLVEVE